MNGEQHKGVIFPKLQNAPASVVKSLGDFRQSKTILADITESFKSPAVGPVLGRVTAMKDIIGSTDPAIAQFVAQVRSYQNSLIKAITGAQMSEPEAKRIMAQMPQFKDNPKAFIAKLQTAARLADTTMANHLKALKAGGYALKEDVLDEAQAEDLVKKAFGDLGSKLNTSATISKDVQAIDQELADIDRQLQALE